MGFNSAFKRLTENTIQETYKYYRFLLLEVPFRRQKYYRFYFSKYHLGDIQILLVFTSRSTIQETYKYYRFYFSKYHLGDIKILSVFTSRSTIQETYKYYRFYFSKYHLGDIKLLSVFTSRSTIQETHKCYWFLLLEITFNRHTNIIGFYFSK